MFEYYVLSLFHNAPLILGVVGCVLIVSIIVAPIITGNLKIGSVFIFMLVLDIAIGCLLPSGADYARSLLDRSDISHRVRVRAEEIIRLEASGNHCMGQK